MPSHFVHLCPCDCNREACQVSNNVTTFKTHSQGSLYHGVFWKIVVTALWGTKTWVSLSFLYFIYLIEHSLSLIVLSSSDLPSLGYLTIWRHRLQRKPLVSDPGMNHGTCVMHVPWCMSRWLIRGENALGIPGACAARKFMYLVRGPGNDV